MGTFQVGLLLIGTFALLLALSVPVSVSIIISSVVTMASTLSLDLGTFVASQRMVGGVDSFSLLAVPFYILCGVLMNTGGIAQKLIDFAKICRCRQHRFRTYRSDHSSFRHPDHLSGAGWLLCGGHDHVWLHSRPDVGTGLHGGGVCHRKEEPLSHCG